MKVTCELLEETSDEKDKDIEKKSTDPVVFVNRKFNNDLSPLECYECYDEAKYYVPWLDRYGAIFTRKYEPVCQEHFDCELIAWKKAGVAAEYYELKKSVKDIPSYMKGNRHCAQCDNAKTVTKDVDGNILYTCWYCVTESLHSAGAL